MLELADSGVDAPPAVGLGPRLLVLVVVAQLVAQLGGLELRPLAGVKTLLFPGKFVWVFILATLILDFYL